MSPEKNREASPQRWGEVVFVLVAVPLIVIVGGFVAGPIVSWVATAAVETVKLIVGAFFLGLVLLFFWVNFTRRRWH